MNSVAVMGLLNGLAAAWTHTLPRVPADTVVRQVDHIIIAVANPRPLFALLSDTLRLPIAWPVTNYGRFESGGVSVGNVNIEILRVDPAAGSAEARGSARLIGIQFEPVLLARALEVLTARGLAHGPSRLGPTDDPPPTGAFSYTNVGLPGISVRGMRVSLVEYRWPDIHAYRQALNDSLRQRAGGPLGLLAADVVVVGAGGDAAYEAAWGTLLAPGPMREPGVWVVGAGPAIQVDLSAPKGLHRLVLRVRSLSEAVRFLRAAGLLGDVTANDVRLAPERVYGLDIRLVPGA